VEPQLNDLPQDINTHIARRIPEVLPPVALSFLHRASDLAAGRGWEVYLVGGYVRDCLLKIPDYDIDVAVVGDAPALARLVAKEAGAQLEVHEAFGTAVLSFRNTPFHIDMVTARRERYERPGALPTVEPGTIADDMARRDFTMNAMAVSLLPGTTGPLFDPHGGLADLRARHIRVLHDGSFVDDPTRIFRAVKLAVRLVCRIEPHTLELILQAVRDGVLVTVSMDRITRELLLIMEEPKGEQMLAELDRLGVLANIHPALGWRYSADRGIVPGAEQLTKEQRRDAYLAVIAAEFAGAPGEAEELARWLKLPAPMFRLMHDAAQLVGVWEQLGEEGQQPSTTYRLLRGLDPRAIEAALRIGPLTENTHASSHVSEYLQRLRFVKPELNGEYLRALGVPSGPIYRQILDALLDAKLDGQLPDRAAEEEFVRQKLAAH
jgi:tRNA nucleotidyltransferase (CCA-adding enzyme)